jgi:DNA polymerase-1
MLIDGNLLAGRCRATTEDLATTQGVASGVVNGFIRSLLWAEREMEVNHEQVVVFWDYGRSVKRMELYPEYKAGRESAEPTPEEIKSKEDYVRQLNALHAALKHVGVTQCRVHGVEADDLIGIFSKFYEDQENEIVIFSGDKDMHQLVSGRVHILDAKKGLLKEEAILQAWGVHSVSYIPYYKALVGDASDNISGIGQVGDVRAQLILKHLDLRETTPRWLPADDPKAAKWVEHAKSKVDILIRNLQLMKLPRRWDESFYSSQQMLEATWQLLHSGRNANDVEFVRFCKEWELNSILEHYGRW